MLTTNIINILIKELNYSSQLMYNFLYPTRIVSCQQQLSPLNGSDISIPTQMNICHRHNKCLFSFQTLEPLTSPSNELV